MHRAQVVRGGGELGCDIAGFQETAEIRGAGIVEVAGQVIHLRTVARLEPEADLDDFGSAFVADDLGHRDKPWSVPTDGLCRGGAGRERYDKQEGRSHEQ